jgi:hypothetical protein
MFGNLILFRNFKINLNFLVFIFFILISLTITIPKVYFLGIEENLKILSYLVRFSNFYMFSYLLYQHLYFNIISKASLIKILRTNFYVLTILNIVQLIFFSNLGFLAVHGWDPHINRLTGTFLDPNFMAFYLCLYFVLNEVLIKSKWISIISIISIFLTISRNGIITFIIIYLIINFKKLKKLFLITVILFTVALISPNFISRFQGFQDHNDSSYLRIGSWFQATQVFVFGGGEGVGFNNYKNSLINWNLISIDDYDAHHSTSSDSSLLFILSTTGVIGLILILLLLLSFIKNKYSLGVVLGLLFNSLFINSFFYPQTSVLLFLTLLICLDLNGD